MVARVALHTHSYKKTIKSYTSFPISFGCDDDEEQRSSVGDNGLEGDMNSNDMREFHIQ